MNQNNTRRGFTLIELLVVVLIIGILAAVALPQYQKAVVKSRVASILPIVNTLRNAEDVYYLTNGNYTHAIQDLDVAIPCIETFEDDTYHPYWQCGDVFLVQVSDTGSYASYCPGHNDTVATCKQHRDFQIAYNYSRIGGRRYCIIKNDSSLGESICKTIGQATKILGEYLIR